MTTKNQSEVKKEDGQNSEVETLKQELAQMKEMFAAFMAAQNVQREDSAVDVKEPIYNNEEEELEISPTRMVKIMSMVNGGLNLKGNRPVPIRLRDFGSSTRVTFDELRSICDNHYELARQGGFIIQDELAVKALYLTDEYSQMMNLNRQTIEKFIDLPVDQLVPTLKAFPQTIQETILQKVVQNIYSGDNRYTDLNKLQELNNFTGKDLMELAREIRD